MWTAEDRSDKRSLRASIATAVVVHAVLLAVTFPQVYSRELDDDRRERDFFVVQTPRFKPPPTHPTRTPPRPARHVPVPDPTPYEPELRVADEPELFELDDHSADLVFNVPDAPPEPESEEPIIVTGEVTPPERIHYVAPRYPEAARRVRREGTVILQTTISRRGEVTDVRVLKSLPLGLTEEAVRAVEQWRFRPATLGGRPVAVYYNLTVRFELR